MKRILATVACALAILLPLSTPAYALTLNLSDARIDADNSGLLVEKVIEGRYFVKEDHLEPGSVITRSYVIDNTSDADYELYLHAERPINTPSTRDLLNHINLALTLDGAEIYTGHLPGERDIHGHTMQDEIYLGLITPYVDPRLTATFTLDGEELDNDWQSAQADVDWVFRAVRVERPEQPVPAAGGKSANVKTGDIFQIALVACIFLLTLIISLITRRRQQRDEYQFEYATQSTLHSRGRRR